MKLRVPYAAILMLAMLGALPAALPPSAHAQAQLPQYARTQL